MTADFDSTAIDAALADVFAEHTGWDDCLHRMSESVASAGAVLLSTSIPSSITLSRGVAVTTHRYLEGG